MWNRFKLGFVYGMCLMLCSFVIQVVWNTCIVTVTRVTELGPIEALAFVVFIIMLYMIVELTNIFLGIS